MILCKPYKQHDTAIYVKCDICSITEFVNGTEGQTDRCLAHDWIHKNNWKTVKDKNRWMQLCPICKEQFYQNRRSRRMIKKELYTCEICHKDYVKQEEAERCEKEHIKVNRVLDCKYHSFFRYPSDIEIWFEDGTTHWFKG